MNVFGVSEIGVIGPEGHETHVFHNVEPRRLELKVNNAMTPIQCSEVLEAEGCRKATYRSGGMCWEQSLGRGVGGSQQGDSDTLRCCRQMASKQAVRGMYTQVDFFFPSKDCCCRQGGAVRRAGDAHRRMESGLDKRMAQIQAAEVGWPGAGILDRMQAHDTRIHYRQISRRRGHTGSAVHAGAGGGAVLVAYVVDPLCHS